MARKNIFAGLTEEKPAVVTSGPPPHPTTQSSLAYAARGPAGSLTRSIDDLATRAKAAKELEARLTAGQVIVELDADAVDPSFIADRMAQDDDSYQALRDAIAADGQASPILVRPHPNRDGRYQVAFGHRRLRVAKDLGRPVRAVVRTLSDQELVLAQGQENSTRTDLSFIERARFAHRLETIGYGRDVIMSALAVDKTTVSRMIAVATRIPASVIEAIGPAPGTGRDRWVDLAGRFEAAQNSGDLSTLLASEGFLEAGSDARFNLVVGLLVGEEQIQNAAGKGRGAGRLSRHDLEYWAPAGRKKMIALTHNARSCVMSIDQRSAPGFGDFLLRQMDRLFREYQAAKMDGEAERAGGELT